MLNDENGEFLYQVTATHTKRDVPEEGERKRKRRTEIPSPVSDC